MKRVALAFLLAAGCASEPDGPADPADIDALIESRLVEAHKPGLSAAVVRDGQVVWTGAYGLADVAAGTPVTSETLFEIASISKTVTATALLQLWEQGLFQLDDDISAHLPYPVQNPAAPATPITFRHLLAHTSSIRDNWDVMEAITAEDADCAVPLADFMSGYFQPGGAYYDAAVNYATTAPGATYEYSNVGVALVGHLVERISGQSLDDYTREHIFTPLGMTRSTWRTAQAMPLAARPHEWNGTGYDELPLSGFPDWPSAQLYTNASELGRFLAAFARGGELDGVRILAADTVAEASRVQFPMLDATQGLVWYYDHDGEYLGHDGEDPGWASEMYLRVSDDIGLILLLNGDWGSDADNDAVYALEADLFEAAPTL